YDRLHSREIARYGGLVNNMPRYAFAFMVFTMASVGLPGTSGFIGEFLVMVGVFKSNTWAAAFITTGIILGAAYMLWLYRRVITGIFDASVDNLVKTHQTAMAEHAKVDVAEAGK